MKFAFCVEDETDEAIFAAILGKILGADITPDDQTYRFPPGGWTQALRLAYLVARRAYHGGLDGAVFAIDNDGAIEHEMAHSRVTDCRVCQLKVAASIDDPLSWPRPALPPLRYFFAVPVQAVETWLLLVRGHVFQGRPEGIGVDATGRRLLKRWLYGDENPRRERMLEVAIPLAAQLEPDVLASASRSFADLFTQR